jgi:hypothetical protein
MPTTTAGSRSRHVRADKISRHRALVSVCATLLLGRGCAQLERPKLEDSGFAKEVRQQSSLLLSKTARGFVQYSLSSSDNTVLIYSREQTNKAAHIKLVTELTLEVKKGIPLNRAVRAEEWIVNALYHYGGPRLQFESTHVRGTLSISSLASAGPNSRDLLNLVFFDPSIDLAGVREAAVNIEFVSAQ